MKTVLAETSRIPFAKQIEEVVDSMSIVDIHTHLYDPVFKDLLLWGIDDLLTYHYLVAEAFRYLDMPAEKFWALAKTRQADLIWDALFVQHSPISEARAWTISPRMRIWCRNKARAKPPKKRRPPPARKQ